MCKNILPQLEYFNFRRASRDWVFDPMVIDFHDLSYVVGGSTLLENAQGELTPLSAGDLLYLTPGAFRHSRSTGEGIAIYAMNFVLPGEEAGGRLPFPSVSHIGVRPEIIALLQDLHAVWIQKREGYALMARAYCELIIAKLMELVVYKDPLSNADARIRSLITYISEHYAEPLPLRELAQRAQMSPEYLSTLFHRNMGVPLRRYINTIRVNQAENLLMNNICNVTEAADLSGFTDVAYFSKIFTRYKGYSPSAIMKNKKS